MTVTQRVGLWEFFFNQSAVGTFRLKDIMGEEECTKTTGKDKDKEKRKHFNFFFFHLIKIIYQK